MRKTKMEDEKGKRMVFYPWNQSKVRIESQQQGPLCKWFKVLYFLMMGCLGDEEESEMIVLMF